MSELGADKAVLTLARAALIAAILFGLAALTTAIGVAYSHFTG